MEWYSDQSLQKPYNFADSVTTSLTLYAKYTPAAVGSIACSDGTVSLDLISGKTPVGIVVEVAQSGRVAKIVGLREAESVGWQGAGTQAVVTGASSPDSGSENMAAIQKQNEWKTNHPAFAYSDYGQLCQDGGN